MIQNYSDPIVTLNQVYRAMDVGTTPVLGACIIGPNYLVREYEDFGESLRLDSDENYPKGQFSNSYSYNSGLSVRYLPARLKNDKDYLNIRVLIKDARLRYASFSSDSVSFVLSNSALDQLSIREDGTLIKFKDPEKFDDVYAVGDEVILEMEGSNSGSLSLSGSSSNKYYQKCQITAIIKDENGDFTKCVLSKKIISTDTIKKIQFFRYKNCYLSKTSMSTPINDSVQCVSISSHAVSEPIFLGEERKATSYPIYGGAFYAEYKAFSTNQTTKYGQLSSLELVEETLGKISTQNPLAIAVASALKQAEGNFVYFVALDENPERENITEQELVQSYRRAASIIADVDGIHGIVPCTNNKEVLKALLNFVEEQSSQQVPYFKYLYGSADVEDKRQVISRQDGQCNIQRATSDSVSFTIIELTKTVLPTVKDLFGKGDFVGYIDDNGNEAFTKIIACDNKKYITAEGTDIPDDTTKIALYKALTSASDIVAALVQEKQIANKRCSIVFADGPMYDGSIKVPNYCTAANLAGLRSVSEPHAPLSNVVLKGITCTEQHGITKKLSDVLGANGFWRVGTDLQGNCISKRQLTSAASNDVNYDEQSIVTNIDSICLDLKTTGRAYVGNTNISGALLDILENLLVAKLDKYKKYTNSLLGPQLLSGKLISIEQDPVYKDRIYASLDGEPPKPFNKFHITFYML